MHQLAIIRHGEFTKGESQLNAQGKEQVNALISALESFHPTVYSSLGPRSTESAKIIAEALGTKNVAYEFFGSNNRQEEAKYYHKASEFLNRLEGNVVVVTKGEWASEFVPYFYKKCFNKGINAVDLERGKGVLIDCRSGTVSALP